MERKISGLDFLEGKRLRESIEEAFNEGLIDEKDPAYIEQMKMALELMDPAGGDFEHMFKDENKLIGINGKPITVKNSKWSQVFYTIINWKDYRDKFEKRKEDRKREMSFKRKTKTMQETLRA